MTKASRKSRAALEKGTGRKYLDGKNIADAEKAAQTLDRCHDLPASIEAIRKALDATRDEGCTARRLEEILSADSATAAKLLKLANSAFFGVRCEVKTAATAVSVIGFRRLRTLLLHLMAGRILESLAAERPGVAACRELALVAAVTAATIGEQLSRDDEAELRIAGLMHNIGELATAATDPHGYRQVVESDAVTEAARDRYGLDFERLSGALMRSWGFPSVYVEAGERWREGPPETPEAVRCFVAIIHVAGRTAIAKEQSREGDALYGGLFEIAARPPLELPETAMGAIVGGVDQSLPELIRTL